MPFLLTAQKKVPGLFFSDPDEPTRKAGRFKQLVIVAAPAMLGELRAHLDAPTASCVTAAFDKEVTGQDPDTILQLIDTQS